MVANLGGGADGMFVGEAMEVRQGGVRRFGIISTSKIVEAVFRQQ